MGKPRCFTAGVVFIGIGAALAAGFFGGCREKSSGAVPPPSTGQVAVTVASLSPAATNLIIGMGAEAHLIAVSTYDPAGSRKLPAVGDYQTTDWETLAELRPSVMIIQMDPARLPAGFAQKAAQIGIRLVNVRIDNLNDIFAASRQIGREIGAAPQGEALADQLAARIDVVRKKGAGKPLVKTLLSLDERAETLIGPNTFLNDMLEAAGGQNAAAPLQVPYPKADVESLLALSPEAVILLQPYGSDANLQRAKLFWGKLPETPAGKAQRVYLVPDAKVLLPGASVAEITERMYALLHGSGHEN